MKEEDQERFSALETDIERIKTERDDLNEELNESKMKIKQLMETNIDMQAQINSLSQLVSVKDDLSKQLEQLTLYVKEL